jgi:hypothetical protein
VQKTQSPPPGARGLSEGIFASAGQRSGGGGRGNGEGVVCSCWRATTVSHASYKMVEGGKRERAGTEGPLKSSPRFTATTSTNSIYSPFATIWPGGGGHSPQPSSSLSLQLRM